MVVETKTNENVEQIKKLAVIEMQSILQQVKSEGREVLNSYELDCLNRFVEIVNIAEEMKGGQIKAY